MRNKLLFGIGLCFIILGIILNECLIAKLFTSDGVLGSLSFRSRIFVFEIFLIISGYFIIKYRNIFYLKNIFLTSIGLFLILCGILFNDWFFDKIFCIRYGTLSRTSIWIFNIVIILLGLLIIRYQNKDMVLNFSISGFSIFVALIILEFFLRFINPPLIQGIGTDQTEKAKFYGWALPPNTKLPFINPDNGNISYFKINSHGWKDIEHQFEKPQGIHRILFLGDSNTYGVVPLEDLYTRKVDQLLKERGMRNIEVITIGVGGWGTDQCLEALVTEGIKYHPDLVIYTFCGNDVLDNLPPSKDNPDALQWKKPFDYKVQNGELIRVSRKVQKTKKKCLYKIVMLDKIIKFKDNLFNKNIIVYEALQNQHWWEPYAPDPTSSCYPYSPSGESSDLRYAWNLLELLILKMKTVSQENNAKFIVFSEESDEGKRLWNIRWNQISTDGISDYIIREGKKYSVDWKRPLKNLTDICDKHNIPLIKPKRKYDRYEYDPHANSVGNSRMAEDITEFLISRF